MFTKIQSFKAQEYSSVIKTYEQWKGAPTPKAYLAVAIIFTQDSLHEVMEFVTEQVRNVTEAIVIDLYHVADTYLEDDIETYASAFLESAGYINLYPDDMPQSHEHWLVYGYGLKEECE